MLPMPAVNEPPARPDVSGPSLRFGAYELQLEPPRLRRDGEPVAIGATALQLLVALARAGGDFVDKDALIRRVWNGVHVSEASLYTALREARRAVGDDGKRQTVIVTKKGRGYRFAAPLQVPQRPRLAREEMARRLAAADGTPAPPALVERVWARTEGDLALFADLALQLEREGLQGLGAALAAETLPLGAAALDEALESLPRLPESLRTPLEAASILGREIPLDLAPVLGLDPDATSAQLERAIALGWLEPVPGRPRRLRFVHPAARERLYASIPARQRAAWHLAAARFRMAASDGHELPAAREIARHLCLAHGETSETEALEWCVLAAESALRARDLEEASVHYEAALAFSGDAPLLRRYALASSLGEARFRAGDHPGGRDAFARAAELARLADDPERLARAALGHAGGIANTETATASPERVRLLEEALARAEALDPATAARLRARLARDLRWTERHPEVGSLVEQALAGSAQAPPADRVEVLHDALWAGWSLDDLDRRLSLCEEMDEAARRSSDPLLRFLAGSIHGACLLEAGDRARAESVYARGRQAAPDDSHAGVALWDLSLRACLALLDGRFAEAESLMRRLHEGSRRLRSLNADTIFAAQLAWLRFDQGRLAELVGAVSLPPRSELPLTRVGAALVLAHAGRTTEARAELRGLVGALDELARDAFWIATLATLVDLAVALDDAGAAAACRSRLAPFADRCVQVGVRTVCRGSVSTYLGLAARLEGRGEEAIAHLERAIEANARLRAAPILARTQLALAETLDERGADGDRERAQGLRAEALRTRRALGLEDQGAARPASAGSVELKV